MTDVEKILLNDSQVISQILNNFIRLSLEFKLKNCSVLDVANELKLVSNQLDSLRKSIDSQIITIRQQNQ